MYKAQPYGADSTWLCPIAHRQRAMRTVPGPGQAYTREYVYHVRTKDGKLLYWRQQLNSTEYSVLHTDLPILPCPVRR